MISISSINRATFNGLALQYEERLSVLKKIKKETTSYFLTFFSKDKTILDVGCGIGYDTLLFSKKLKAVGIDFSEEMTKIAKRRNPKSTVINDSFLDKKFRNKFDGIFANAFIHLFPKPIALRILRKMKGLLKNGGFAYISTTKSLVSKEGWYEKADYKGKNEELKRFRKFWTEEELEGALETTGFNIVSKFYVEDPFGKIWLNFIVQKF